MQDRHDARAGDVAETAGCAEVPARADARRNRTAILTAAEDAFAREGLGVPVDEIARRAGVGAGTVYRNFPTKEALFEAVLVRHMEGLAAEAEELARDDHPGAALFTLLHRLADEASHRRNLVEAMLGSGVEVGEALKAAKEKVERAVALLLARAQEAGEVRGDIAVDDLFGMVIGCAIKPLSADSDAHSRMVSVICDGLRP